MEVDIAKTFAMCYLCIVDFVKAMWYFQRDLPTNLLKVSFISKDLKIGTSSQLILFSASRYFLLVPEMTQLYYRVLRFIRFSLY